ncbi:ABC transporter ATP-binding protein/permease [Thomasclavelia spiroformis DSM 1552]|uniref:ABC transporter, ATP-binding protein n=1 Tax=Thomasclavelia spiroformis DSM 1552 TaxID=428126 RepID=B1C1Q7_9FIRM|nr:ABC transporter ATP-binding protein [Thomasclavelia spiroformis]EDS74849.1 ABC transporter, ATP-binding protein [Thomasclavelia spiroformis DSM 1552]UWO88627.1 ABC transporter ATP-binding protein/permease [Thomasclavelia spiroformis DSM 1552]
MLKLKHYFKKFWAPILLCVGLLFMQSQSELALPDYMSDIVSVGIQAGGFDSAVSDVLSEETFNHLLVLLNEDDQTILEDSYQLVTSKDIDQDLLDKFSKAKGKNLYELKELDDEEMDQLEDILIKPMLLITSIDSMDPNSKEYQEQFGSLPAGMSPYDAIGMMPQDQKDKMFEKIDQQMETMGESTLKIAAGNGVKAEYEKLGCDVDQVQNSYILQTGIKMLGIALIGTACAIGCGFLASKVGSGVSRLLRSDVFKKVESFSNEEFNKFSTASLITRTTNDITQVQMVVIMFIRIVCFAPMMGIGALIKAFNNTPSMTWIIGLVLIIIFMVIIVTFIIVMPKFKIVQSLIDKLNLTMRENLSGMLVIRAFGNEEHSEQRFDKANSDLTKVNLFVNRTMVSMMPIMMFIFNIVSLLIVYYGAKQIDLGNIAIGQMMAFMQYAMQIIMSFLMIAMIAIMLPRASVAANRIYEVLSMEVKISDPKNPESFDENKKGLVEFKNVTFKYPGANEAVLENISFTAKPGETTAFIGSTGSGKSTLINLIPRFYEVTDGKIEVDGVDIRNVNQHDLRDKIGLIPQKGLLFSGTIKSNLTYGAPDAADEELEEVIKIAQAKEFIDQKEKRLDDPISQGGTNVSGGQKQRLAIARAIAKKPEIFIFDDSFSALDFKTDAKLRNELNKMIEKTRSTVLIVGQRIASIMSANQIIVLDEGKIVGKGTHDELMKNCKVYQEIAYSQLSKEELGHE